MTRQNFAIPANTEQSVVGYNVNAMLSDSLAHEIHRVQISLAEKFPEAIWTAPRDSLHITLMDWLVPFVDYGQDINELFRSIRGKYTTILKEILKDQSPIWIAFDTIEVYPSAIIIKGHDDGSYQRIREQFLERIDLLPGTKPPGKIVHSTICKFLQPIDIDKVIAFAQGLSIDYLEEVTDFVLTKEERIFMLDYEVLGSFKLEGHNNSPALSVSDI